MKQYFVYFKKYSGKLYYSTIYAKDAKEAKELFLERIDLSLLLNILKVTVYAYKITQKAEYYELNK